MQLKTFIANLEKMNFSLSVEEGKLILKGDRKKLSKEEIEAIKTNKDVIDYIKSHKDELIGYISMFPGIPVAKNAKDIVSVYRLSGLQQGMLFHGLYDNLGSYLEQFACDLAGANLEMLMASWTVVIKRHSILRSAFYYDSFNVPVQCVYREVKLPVENLDYSGMDETSQRMALKEYAAADRARGFDFKSPPLMRLSLIRLKEDRYRMLWTSHHILFDGWSLPILIEEFLNTYESMASGQALPEAEEDRYEDYIRYLERRDKDVEEDYWRNYLQGINKGVLLPFIKTTTERTKGIGKYGSLSIVLDGDATARIQTYVQSHRLTMNTLMQGIWAWLLHKYTGEPAILYGAVVSGRPAELHGVEHRVGMYINTLAFKAVFNEDQEIGSWLQGLQAEQVSSRQHQYAALQDVQSWMGIKGDLFDSLLIFENYPVNKLVASGAWSLQVDNVEITEQTNYPLTIIVGIAEELNISFSYNTDLLEQAYVAAIRDHFKQVLLQITDGLADTLNVIRMLTASEERTLVSGFNDTQKPYPKDKSIVDLFREQVLKSPTAKALLFEDQELSYGELNERSNQLARYLQKKGVKTETLVPICVERGLEMVTGILGILKAGGAYVPIDPDYPAGRISYMLEDTGAGLALSSKACREKLGGNGITIIEIDGERDLIGREAKGNLDVKPSPGQLAYVIYTSGSTGKPKGVMIEHGGVVNLSVSQSHALRLKPGMRALQFASFGFDASCYEIFNTLLSGGCLVLCSKEDLLSAQKFRELVEKYQVELAVLPPSFQLTLDDKTLGILKTIVSAGEPLSETTGRRIQSQGIRLINAYGPTETTVCASLSDDPVRPDHIITIGKPVANTRIYILSPDGVLSPKGVTGEICIGGAGLARGYLNRSELTAEKFIRDPFSKEAGARLYKTGDLGRWLPDGNIEYLGRMDDQVKIRGYRIELGEIESVLNQSGLVGQGVVLALEDSGGDKRLLGYVVPQGLFDKQAVRNYLSAKLPEYMVPAIWVELERMPLTPSGKIDRKALPDPETALPEGGYVAPQNETEARLAGIWQEVLGVDKVGMTDDFFELGGHSLLAVRLISAIRKAFGMEMPISDVFDYPTIRLMAERLSEKLTGNILPPIMPKAPRSEHIPLSFSQERLWFIDRLEGSVQYHIPAVLRLKGSLNFEALRHTLRAIIGRHEVLRTVIREQEGQGYQHIMAADNWSLGIIEAPAGGEAGLRPLINGLINKPFDLSSDYMLRADLIKIGKEGHILVATMHHIASDGWSTSILVKEVIALYKGYTGNAETALPELLVQYADYAIWQRQYMQGEVLEEKLAYWKAKLEGTATLQLPCDRPRPAIQSSRGAAVSFEIGRELSRQVQALSHEHGATLYMTLLAAFKVLLYRYSGQEDICVGTPVAGRSQQELEGLIGFFINTLVLRSRVSGDMSFNELLEEVKATTLEAYGRQEVPFEKVVEAVVKERDMGRSPLFQVMFVLQNTPEVPELKLGDLHLTLESNEQTISKYDLAFFIEETKDGFQGTVEYSTDLYEVDTIERMIGHYINLLGSVISSAEKQVSRLGMLDVSEKATLLEDFNNTAADYPKDKSIVGLFEEQVRKTPEAIAVVFEEETLTYKELNERSNRLARYLQKKGVKAETLVPICMERSPEMVVGILGIMKAGGAYVPIDPEYPTDRISYMLEDTGAKIVLSSAASREKLGGCSLPVIELDGDREQIEKEKSGNLQISISPARLAYVIYTSGSTGRPKGVMIEHGSLVNLIAWHNQEYRVTETAKTTSMAGVGFDAFGWEIWPYLSAGASIYIIDDEIRLSASALLTLFIDKRITHSFISTAMVPDFISASRDKPGSLKYLLTGGDKLSVLNLDGIHYKLVNNYGPTENTVVATNYIVSPKDKVPSIGKPISNTRIYILSADGCLSPVGVTGEICIGGAGLARGYLHRAELTAEKFIKDPFSKETGARLYKTGDLGRWLADGNIEYLGRTDDQVKIRGYRIELGEIESVLNQSGLVSQGVVLAKADSGGNRRLVGYIVPQGPFDKKAVQSYLSAKLPDYMIPAMWVELERIPLTPNGKIDRKSLPDPEISDLTVKYAAPRNETEAALALIWQELLNVERVGIYDNFFELGGHSLLAMRAVSYIERDLSVSIPIHMLFQFTSINDLGKYLEIQSKGNYKERNTGTFKVLDV